jgi:hypothetical protein
VLNSVAVTATGAYVAAHGPSAAALVHGFAAATGWSALALTATAVVTAVLIRTPRPDRAET